MHTRGLVLALLLAASAAIAGAPVPRLDPKGHSPDWVKQTARCRELVAKLDPAAPLVRKHLPILEEKLELLRRVDSFDWKRRTAIDFAEDLLTDLAAGTEPFRRYAGKGIAFPYWSDAGNLLQAIWVHVPPRYDPAASHQLFVYYKCGGGIHFKDGKAHGGYRPSVDVANQTDTFHAWSSLHIQVKGRMCVDRELEEASAALARVFSIGRDRVFLSGWSDGGFTALWIASRFPHLVAGIAPACGNWQYTNIGDVNLTNLPTLAVDGWGDGGYNSSQFRRWHALHTMGADAAGIWGHHGHAYKPFEDVGELRRILAWAKTRRRNLWPRRVRYATWNLTWHRAYWVSIERTIEPALAAQIDVQAREGNRIDVTTTNVAAYRLTLGEKLVDTAKPVTVATDGKPSYAGPFRPELAIELVPQPGKFVKSAALPGGLTAQATRSCYGARGYAKIADRPWLWVKPTGGDDATRNHIAKWLPDWATPDTKVTDDDIARANLYILGGPDVNRLAARIAPDLPVAFAPGRFTIGGRVYGQPSHSVQFIHPNPLNPKRYVVVCAFNDAATFARNGFHGTGSVSAWKFRSGDCVVRGIPAARPKWSVAMAEARFETRHIVFDANWRAPAAEPLGTLAKPFDVPQILRLRADAIREATGADAGIIATHTPGWNRWRTTLPAGPVTTHDLATIDMLPEYVALADVAGEELARMAARASAATPLPHPVEPQKTYRVAMGYHGLPAYGAEPGKMPKLHFFTSPDEFLAGGHTSLPVRNLRHTAIDIAKAAADFIRKRGTVSPRAVHSDLPEYILNPQVNHFAACDWLHVGLDGDWASLQGGTPQPLRYSLAIGLRPAAGPPDPTPRDGYKSFLDVPLGPGRTAAFRFASLPRKLPVDVAIETSEVAIAADAGGTAFRLTTPATKEAAARAALVSITLTHRGDRPLAGIAVLAGTALRRIHPHVLTVPKERGKPSRCAGMFTDFKKPTRAALRILASPAKTQVLALRNAGWNFGLIGVREDIALKPGTSLALPVLIVAAAEPKGAKPIGLAVALDAVRPQVLGRLGLLTEE